MKSLLALTTVLVATFSSVSKAQAAPPLRTIDIEPTAPHEQVQRGPDLTGGGDLLVMNFKIAGRNICRYLKSSSNSSQVQFDRQAFCDHVARVNVTSQAKTYLEDGTEVDAINSQEKKFIKLGYVRNKDKTFQQLLQLAIHEYIDVSGGDDKGYLKSESLAEEMSQEFEGQIKADSVTRFGNSVVIVNPRILLSQGKEAAVYGLSYTDNSTLVGNSFCKYLGYRNGNVTDTKVITGDVIAFNILKPGTIAGLRMNAYSSVITSLTCSK